MSLPYRVALSVVTRNRWEGNPWLPDRTFPSPFPSVPETNMNNSHQTIMAAKTSNPYQWLPEDEELLGTQVLFFQSPCLSHLDCPFLPLIHSYFLISLSNTILHTSKAQNTVLTFTCLHDYLSALIFLAHGLACSGVNISHRCRPRWPDD